MPHCLLCGENASIHKIHHPGIADESIWRKHAAMEEKIAIGIVEASCLQYEIDFLCKLGIVKMLIA